MNTRIIVRVRDGMVELVEGVPPDVTVEIRDFDAPIPDPDSFYAPDEGYHLDPDPQWGPYARTDFTLDGGRRLAVRS